MLLEDIYHKLRRLVLDLPMPLGLAKQILEPKA